MNGDPGYWHLEWDASGTRLMLDIEGHLDAEQGETSAARLRELGAERPFELVANLSLMTGYDRRAREAWQQVFGEIRPQLRAVRFVGLGPVFRMAAATVCLATRIPADFFESVEAIPHATPPPGRP